MLKHLSVILFLAVLILNGSCVNGWDPKEMVVISHDTTFIKSNSPYIIRTDITIDTGVTLTIEPGVTLSFEDTAETIGFDLIVNGKLNCLGTKEDRIRFIGDCGTIQFVGTRSGILKWCKFEAGYLKFDTTDDLQIINCYFFNSSLNFKESKRISCFNNIFWLNMKIVNTELKAVNNIFVSPRPISFSNNTKKQISIINNIFFPTMDTIYFNVTSGEYDFFSYNCFGRLICFVNSENIMGFIPSNIGVKNSDDIDSYGNLMNDPLFSDDNFHLNDSSKCIDSGNPDTIYSDLDGSRNNMGIFGGKLSW